MQLVQKKKLDLDADVRKYVSEFAPQGPPITVRQLMCHQSGLPHWTNGRVVPSPDLDAEAMASIDPLVTVRRFSQTPLLFEPGSRFSYSSYGYILLSAVIEQAGGESFYVQIAKRIARPLGLESLQLDMVENHADWAVGYTRNKGTRSGRPIGRNSRWTGAGLRPRLEGRRRCVQIQYRRLRQMGRSANQRTARLQESREGNVDAAEDVGREVDGNEPGIFHRRMGREPDDHAYGRPTGSE